MASPTALTGASVTSPFPTPTSTSNSTPTTLIHAPSVVRRDADALSTPFVYAASCTPTFVLATARSDIDFYAIVRETFLYQDIGANGWEGCQPPGLTANYRAPPPIRNQVYHGAVCPEGWVANQVGLDSFTGKDRERTGPATWSTAYCCRSGDRLLSDMYAIYTPDRSRLTSLCASISLPYIPTSDELPPPTNSYTHNVFLTRAITIRTTTYPITLKTYFGRSDTRSPSPTATILTTAVITKVDLDQVITLTPFVKGRVFYPPWSIEWLAEDNETLKPPWPVLTSDMLLPTWGAGDDGTDYDYEGFWNKGKGVDGNAAEKSIRVVIAAPVIAVLGAVVVGAVMVPLWRRWRGRRAGRGDGGMGKGERGGVVREEGLEMGDLGDEGREGALDERPNVLCVEGDVERVVSR